MIKELTYCEKYRGPCRLEKCTAFAKVRTMTAHEKKVALSANKHRTDLSVHNWCLRYNKSAFKE